MRDRFPVCVIGAGLAGLAAAWDLARAGRRVLVVERAGVAGGLACSVEVAGRTVERFHHFICRGDRDLVELVAELGLADSLHWRAAETSFLYRGRLYRFSSPLDLLRFDAVPPMQRLRFGLNVVASRFRRSWRRLDGLPARTWLIDQIGERAYEVIWDPLLRVKFGDAHDRVSAAWIWHRIHRVASSRRRIWERERLGYLERGSQTLLDALLGRLAALPGVEVRTGAGVDEIVVDAGRVAAVRVAGDPEPIRCDQVLSTVALPGLLRMAPSLPAEYREALGDIEYLAVVCGLLRLDRPLTDSFWVNINDPRTPYNGIIEYSNLNRHLELGGGSIVYVPLYLPAGHERFGFDDERLLDEWVRCLECVNPDFDRSWIEEVRVSRAANAQAICDIGFANRMPSHRTPVEGLYLTDSTQYYPEDRTLSGAIRLGRTAARMMVAEDHAS